MNVALTFNVKPESGAFAEEVSSLRSNSNTQPRTNTDTYAEWDTWETINAVKDALETYHNVELIEADHNAYEKLKESKCDIAFNIAEGFNGISREAQIPAILEMLNIPYTGSDPLTLSISLDKSRTKEILSYYNIPNARFQVIDQVDQLKNFNLNFPVIVKPIGEGSSKGIYSSSFAKNSNELKSEVERVLNEYSQPALVEEFLPGREFTVAIIGNNGSAEALPIVEISYNDFPKDFIPIYSYEAKWILDTREKPLNVFSCPAKINFSLEEKIKSTALNTFKVLRCRDWSRIDIRLDKNEIPNVIEINPLPGILPNPSDNSCFPKAARTYGLNYTEMINKVLYVAAKRNNLI
ncbi:MAG: ATP-grasp domain-containing protein [Ignavibacteriaceae bacterium]|nr:ATP-grasp domain-containing protein [Ignavibacteriaceae bacterium]